MPIIDVEKENICNVEELFEESLREFRKSGDIIILVLNHFTNGTFAHISCMKKRAFVFSVVADNFMSINENNICHTERIYRREDKKLLFRTATVL